MKKFNKNIFVFVFCILFVGMGLCSGELMREIREATQKFLNGKSSGFKRISKLEENIDKISTEKLFYHNEMMNVNSLKENLLGTRVVFKDDATVVKSNSGSLVNPVTKIKEEDIKTIGKRIVELKSVAESKGAHFLYCFAPTKNSVEMLPENTENNYLWNIEKFFYEMDQLQIPYIDLSNAFVNSGGLTSDCFYKTDHHWTSRSGFIANKFICNTLSEKFGFEINEDYTDLENYNLKIYKNWFLGSYGKKVGAFFSWNVADDFELITPTFDTSFLVDEPIKVDNVVRQGVFANTVLYMENLDSIDYYKMSPYYVYCGRDSRYQRFINKYNPKGSKILIIRDSYSIVVTPFLSMQASEVHSFDIRNRNKLDKEGKVDIMQKIEEIKPDYVLVLYSGLSSLDDSNGCYDFLFK